ncbi:hypothetical protein BS78_01G430500 [Paspalum vaginatum]|nr:hypothetical protein BS78_01G430500 [Paspalum vaginatum]
MSGQVAITIPAKLHALCDSDMGLVLVLTTKAMSEDGLWAVFSGPIYIDWVFSGPLDPQRSPTRRADAGFAFMDPPQPTDDTGILKPAPVQDDDSNTASRSNGTRSSVI